MRDRADKFASAHCVVLGASFDSVEDNLAFATAQEFGFALLSDRDRSVGRLYETARSDDDQYARFPLRVSYLIDPSGVIRKTYAVADVTGHADEVLTDLAALQSA